MSTRELSQIWKGYALSYINYGLPEIKAYLSRTNLKRLRTFYDVSMRKLAGGLSMVNADLAARSVGLPTSSEWLHKEPGGYPNTLPIYRHLDPKTATRSKEITLFRWRSGVLWINTIKKKFKMVDHARCRFCDLADETREHLLMDCTAQDVSAARETYKELLAPIYPSDFAELTLSDLLAEHSTHKATVQGVADALHTFTRLIGVWG
jgi:hypothetical protein